MTPFLRRLAIAAVALAIAPAAAMASQTYPEHTGDAPGGAPDLTSIVVSHTQTGDVTFSLRFANRTSLVGEDMVMVVIDSHQGAPDGEVEYAIGMVGDLPLAMIVDLKSEAMLGAVPLVVGDGIAVTVPKALIGNPSADFQFGVLSHTGADDMSDDNTEVVPHTGYLRYSVAVAVTKVNVTAARAPKAGAVFRLAPVTVMLTTDETVRPERVVATARINGRLVKPLPGGTAWKIPKTARGKQLAVTVTASYGGTAKTQVLRYTIR